MIEKNLPPEIQLDDDMIAEIVEQSDRGAAIVAFAFLDDRLTEALQSRLHNYKHKGEDISKFMFQGAGPLATFSARRRLALMLGIIGLKTYDDLVRIAQVRNEFAHRHLRRTFKSQKIRGLCEALTTPIFPEYVPSNARQTYVHSTMYLCGSLRVIAELDNAHPARKLPPLP